MPAVMASLCSADPKHRVPQGKQQPDLSVTVRQTGIECNPQQQKSILFNCTNTQGNEYLSFPTTFLILAWFAFLNREETCLLRSLW